MKKLWLLILIVFLFLLGGIIIREKKEEPKENSEVLEYDANYIEIIPENAKIYIQNMDNELLKTKAEINELNQEIFEKSQSMFDLTKIKKIKKEEIINYITQYELPTLPKYNDDKIVTNEEKKAIQSNRNLEAVVDKNNLQHGIIINRANLKSFPTNIHFYDIEGVQNFDSLQESELLVNSEVLILHESKDQEWYFVLSEAYAGWVEKNKIALLKEDDRDLFLENENFLVITTNTLNLNNKILDMSVKLPFQKTVKDGYEAIIPEKGQDDYVVREKVIIPRNKAHIGYLDYTKRNVIIQAFKYEDTPYSWAGLDENVDCSSYISNVYRTFGFHFPRNTSQQNKSIGNIIDLKNKSNSEKLTIIKDLAPALLYQQGHVMIYLGKIDDKDYIIHASGELKNLKVLVSPLNDSTYLEKIYQVNVLN